MPGLQSSLFWQWNECRLLIDFVIIIATIRITVVVLMQSSAMVVIAIFIAVVLLSAPLIVLLQRVTVVICVCVVSTEEKFTCPLCRCRLRSVVVQVLYGLALFLFFLELSLFKRP